MSELTMEKTKGLKGAIRQTPRFKDILRVVRKPLEAGDLGREVCEEEIIAYAALVFNRQQNGAMAVVVDGKKHTLEYRERNGMIGYCTPTPFRRIDNIGTEEEVLLRLLKSIRETTLSKWVAAIRANS